MSKYSFQVFNSEEYKAIKELNLNNYVDVNKWLHDNEKKVMDIEGNFIIVQINDTLYQLNNKKNGSELNFYDFIKENEEELKKLYNEKLKVFVKMFSEDNSMVYHGFIEKENDKFYLVDECNNKIYFEDNYDFTVGECKIIKIIPKNKYNFTVKQLVDNIITNEFMKCFKYSITTEKSSFQLTIDKYNKINIIDNKFLYDNVKEHIIKKYNTSIN